MASTWGSTALKILVGTLKPNVMEAPLTEAQLLPDPAALGTICTVVQQQGRGRKRVKAKLYVSSVAAYESFVTDLNAGTSRTLTIGDAVTAATYMIESLGEPEFIQANAIFFDIVWLEV
jgi:hypothetical protein